MVTRFEQFTASVASIHRSIQKIERVEMAKYGLKGPHAQVLLAMSRFPEGVTSGELVKLCDKDKAAISRVVTEMERKGLVERGAAGSTYRAPVKLTEKGVEAANFVRTRAGAAVEAASRGLADEDRVVLYKALELIASNLQTLCKQGIPEVTTK